MDVLCIGLVARCFPPSRYLEKGKHPTSDLLASLWALLMDSARTISFESFGSFTCWAYDANKARKTKHLVRRAQQRLQAACSRGRVKIDLNREGTMLSFFRKGKPAMLYLLTGGNTLGRTDIHAFKLLFFPLLLLLNFISSAKLEIFNFRHAIGHFITGL